MKYALLLSAMCSVTCHAQTLKHFSTTEKEAWKTEKVKLAKKPTSDVLIEVNADTKGTPFQAWGTTFNELDLDAYRLITKEEQEQLMHNLYAPDGDLHFTHGRVSMNANDYAREWYSCSEVAGDFQLKYFNIEHDKQNIILLAKDAQHYCPELQLFMSPWSPPSWMKINQDYCVLSSKYNKQDPRKDYLLYMEPKEMVNGTSVNGTSVNGTSANGTSVNGTSVNGTSVNGTSVNGTSVNGTSLDPDEMKLLGDRNDVFPKRLATQSYFIQEPRYLQAYADMFCRFINLYKEEGLPITKVMYQNEAYSYTPYPGCPWTVEGTLRFNNEYLAPTLKKHHPDVELWLGTINTNRLDYVEKTLDDKTLQSNIKGIGTQWECRNNLPQLRERYPNLRIMMSESECGNGSMDWRAGEHTFFLISDNLGHGVDEYYNWNFILTDNGQSPWGWKQNALVQVDSRTHKMRYTAEYYAYKHFSHFISRGTEMVGYAGRDYSKTPVNVFRKDGKYIVTAANFTDEVKQVTVKLNRKYLNITMQPHSFNSFVETAVR